MFCQNNLMSIIKNIIGITGTHASGKDTVADHISKIFKIKSYSTSDEVRYEATQQGIDHSRSSLFILANKIRVEFGAGELARRSLDKVQNNVAIITGIRNVGEIDYLKKHSNFFLISVDGPIEVRYERSKNRRRTGDAESLEDFRAAEEKEMNAGNNGQQLIACMRNADYFIINDGSLDDLNFRTDEVMKAIMHNFPKGN